MILAIQGEIVYCGRCGADLYRLIRDVWMDTVLAASLFDPIGGSLPCIDGCIPPPCRDCGSREWFEEFRFHAVRGDFAPVKVLARKANP